MEKAEPVDYAAPAEFFWSSSAKRYPGRGTMRFRAFDSLAQAVRFAINDTSETRHQRAIDTQDARFEGLEIDALFDRPDFPRET